MPAELAVTVTLAHPLSAIDANDAGLPAVALNAGATVTLALSAAQRLVTAGMTTINPTDRAAIEALFNTPTFAYTTTARGNLYVGPQVPADATPPYVWFQTGLGPDGEGSTIWIEDGS